MLRRIEQIATFASLLLLASPTLCAQFTVPSVSFQGAQVAGVVRDLHGVPQMGVMVELLGANVSATAFTDLQGRYRIEAGPGIYQMRASAALFLPAIRRQLTLRAGMKPVVNLTLSGLFEDSAWLPVRQQTVGESAEDWKWTLKSPVNRPMLRLVEDGIQLRSNTEQARGGESHAKVVAAMGSGGFGASGVQGLVVVAHRSADRKAQSVVRSAMSAPGGVDDGVPLMFSAVMETGADTPMQRRLSGRVRTFPEIRDSSGAALSEVEFSTAERMALGDALTVEAGSETQMLRAQHSLVTVHPFLRLSARTGTGWTASYLLATSPAMDAFEDVGSGDVRTPTLVSRASGAETEASLHQELRVQKAFGRVKVQTSYHHDVQRRPAVLGVLSTATFEEAAGPNVPSALTPGIALDRSNGSFRLLGPRFADDGCSLIVEFPIGDQVTVSGGYLNSVGLALSRSMADSTQTFARRGQGAVLSVQGRIKQTGTRLTAAYRWQPGSAVSVLSPYDAEDVAPYLSVHLRQDLPHASFLPSGTEVTLDAINVTGEGYQHGGMITPDALLASALRELRAGIAFTF